MPGSLVNNINDDKIQINTCENHIENIGNILIKNIKGLAGILEANEAPLRGTQMNDVTCIEDAFLAIEDGKISM